jgi:hypothetical protein
MRDVVLFSQVSTCAEIFKQSLGARNRVGRGPARLNRLAELVSRNQFLGSLQVSKCGLWVVQSSYDAFQGVQYV